MFIGEYNYSLDSKGRLNIPAKFREDLGEPFYVTKGLDGCLFVFPKEEWTVFENKLKSLPLTNQSARAFVRLFFSGATECTLDKQGRVTLPPPLRVHGALEKEVKILGVGTRIEIWSEEGWADYNHPDHIDYDTIAGQMAELGI